MTWFMVDDHLPDHAKVRKLGADKLAAMGLWTLCGAWSAANLSEGFVPGEVVARFDSDYVNDKILTSDDKSMTRRLVEVGLWVVHEQDGEKGVLFHEWDGYQLSKAAVLKRRADARDRQKRYRERRGIELEEERNALPQDQDESNVYEPRNGSHNALRDASHDALVTRPPSLPSPNKKKTTTTPSAGADVEIKFAEFWDTYLRKVQKQDARKAWSQQLRKGVTADRIIAGSKGYAAHIRAKGTDLEYVKHPGAWLRAGGYDDFQPPPTLLPDTREPKDILRALWTDADAPAVMRILGMRHAWVDEGPPPSSSVPYEKFIRDRRRSWIKDHSEAAVAALQAQRESA